MSEFSVLPAVLSERAAPLAGFSGQIDTARDSVLQGTGAAEGTPAADALDDLTAHFHARLGDFGASTDALHAAITGAGQNYTDSDQAAAAAVESPPARGEAQPSGEGLARPA